MDWIITLICFVTIQDIYLNNGLGKNIEDVPISVGWSMLSIEELSDIQIR